MSNQNAANPDDIDVAGVVSTVRRLLPRLLGLSALVGALTYGALSMMAPQYLSETELEVSAPFRDPNSSGTQAAEIATKLDKEAVRTHVKALHSRDLALQVAEKLKLESRQEFHSGPGEKGLVGSMLQTFGLSDADTRLSVEDRVLKKYFNRLSVYSPRETRVIGVRFSAADPQLAADVANTIVQEYASRLSLRDATVKKGVNTSLRPKIDKLQVEVANAEKAVREFRAKTGTIRTGQQQTSLIEQQLAELTQELTRAKAARSVAEARAESAAELARSGGASANADVLRSPVIQNLSEQLVALRRERSQLSATLLPGHPNMRRVNADLDSLRRQYHREVAKVVSSLKKEARIAKMREDSIEQSIVETKGRNKDTTPDQIKLQVLQATANSKKVELARLLAQFEVTKGALDTNIAPDAVKVITVAHAASVPYFPKKTPISALATIGTFLLGFAYLVTLGLINGARSGGNNSTPQRQRYGDGDAEIHVLPSRHSAEPMASSAGHDGPVLDTLQPVNDYSASEATSRVFRFNSSEALHVHIEEIAQGTAGFRTLLSGENESIEAGTEAVELALALSEADCTTVLLDWSRDGTSAIQKIGIPISPGMTELLSGNATFEDVIKQIPDGALHVIPCGHANEDAEALLEPDQLNLVLDALDEAYDHIVIIGRYDAARELFESIEGRVDAGIIVGDVKRRVSVIQDPPGTFLGFEVADIALVRFERGGKMLQAQQLVRKGASPVHETHLG